MPSPTIARLMGVITVGMVFSYVRMLIGWLDRRSGGPIMKERINSGSDRFFADEEKEWGRTEIDSIARGKFGEV
jgi:hypothetical protein